MSEAAPAEYDGLNLPQLLDLMHDPVIPEPIEWWPQTPGWWIVLAWLMLVAAGFAWRGYQRYRHNRYRRQLVTANHQYDNRNGQGDGHDGRFGRRFYKP